MKRDRAVLLALALAIMLIAVARCPAQDIPEIIRALASCIRVRIG